MIELSVAKMEKTPTITIAALSSIIFKEVGVGLALAVLLPATMKLLGDWNWYLPSWLRWLPRLAVETATPARGALAAEQPVMAEPDPRPVRVEARDDDLVVPRGR